MQAVSVRRRRCWPLAALLFVCLACCGADRVAGRWDGRPLPRTLRIDRLVVYKAEHELEAWSGPVLQKVYRVAIGSGGAGPKRWEGDRRTPEGRYRIDSRHRSRTYHLFLHVSYPNAADRAAWARGRRDGSVPAGVGVGGAIGIHGEKQGMGWLPHKWVDWTLGCIALDNAEIEELYRAVVPGASIEIHPARR